MPSQIVKKTGKNFEIIFFADVPSYAVHIYAVVPSDEECKIKNDLEVSEHRLENIQVRLHTRLGNWEKKILTNNLTAMQTRLHLKQLKTGLQELQLKLQEKPNIQQ